MKNGKKILVLALAGMMTLAGCTEPTPEATQSAGPAKPSASEETGRETADFVLPCYPTGGFHPYTGNNRLNLTLAPLMYRGLFSLGRDFQATKELCESWEVSEDGLTWSFRLASAEFSDGSPLTAREVVASLNSARESGRYAGRLENLKRVAAEGETVVVTLAEPNGALPVLLDVPVIKEGEEPQRPLGTGPYYLTETEEGLALTARAGAAVPLERIPLRPVGAGDDLVYAFDAREVSLVDTDLTGTNVLGYSGLLETADYPTTTLIYIGCNSAAGACQEQLVRQAVGLALDREKIAGRILAGHGVPSTLPVHPNARGYDAELSGQWERDPERAQALLTQAGWLPDEEGGLKRKREQLALRLVVNQDNTFKVAVAEAAASSLRELGCTVILDKLAWEDYLAVLERGEFDLFLGETALTADFDLEPLLGKEGALNYGRFENEELWQMMEQVRGTAGEERAAALANLCGAVADAAPILPLCFKNGSLLTQWGQVTGASPTQRDVFAGLENWRIDQF